MKKIFIVLFVLIGFKGISQDFSLGLYGGINVNKINHYDTKNEYLKNRFKWGTSGNTGINLELMKKNKFTFDVGIAYYINRTKFYYDYFPKIINYSIYYENYNVIPVFKNFDSKSYNIIVPIKFGYVFGDKFKIIPKIGINNRYITSVKYETLKYNVSTNEVTYYYEKNNNIKYRFNFDFLLDVELRYKLNEKFSVFSEFNYHHYIPTRDFDLKPKFYNNGFDLNFGVRYNLKK